MLYHRASEKRQTISLTGSTSGSARPALYRGRHTSSCSTDGLSCTVLSSDGRDPVSSNTEATVLPSVNSRYLPASSARAGAAATVKRKRHVHPSEMRKDCLLYTS